MKKVEKTTGVYAIQNKLDGNNYAGSAIDIRKRWSEHRYTLNRGIHANIHLQRAWKKYGEENFEFIILQITPDREIALILENWYLENTPCYYNIAKNATKPALGKPQSYETIYKRQLSRKYSLKKSITIYEHLTGKKLTNIELDELKIKHKTINDLIKKGEYERLSNFLELESEEYL